ncbi:MAG: peptide chain release factor N(5)-glutamine methyltransferase [Parvularculaceae bacterium]
MSEKQLTIGAWLREAAAKLPESATPLLDARLLAGWALGLDDAALILKGNEGLSTSHTEKLDAALARRASGEPVAYILGEKEFWGLPFKLERGVLVPRPDSETLIEAIIRRRARDGRWRILDLGTGTGCLLGALLSEFQNADGIGVDIDPVALSLARRNLEALGFTDRARIVETDFNAIEDKDLLVGPFDIIISNPPYIPAGETLPRDVAEFENPLALFAGEDGLDAYRAIFPLLQFLLAEDGIAAFEFGADQGDAIKNIARMMLPAASTHVENDLAGRPRALIIDRRR